MRTINILNAGSTNDYHQGDIVNISGKLRAYNGVYYVDVVRDIALEEGFFDPVVDNKPKKYKSTFIKSHKKVW